MEYVLDGKTDKATYYEYDGAGRATVQRHPNDTTTYFDYDGAARLAEKVTKKDADGSVLVKFGYAREAPGESGQARSTAGFAGQADPCYRACGLRTSALGRGPHVGRCSG